MRVFAKTDTGFVEYSDKKYAPKGLEFITKEEADQIVESQYDQRSTLLKEAYEDKESASK